MKSISSLLFAAGAVASKTTHTMEINVFDFIKSENLVQSLMQSVQQPELGEVSGTLTFSQCADDTGVFTLSSSSSVSPNPVQKSTTETIVINGSVSSPVSLSNVHLHVVWNSSPVSDKDNAASEQWSGDVSYTLNWSTPALLPKGHYEMTLTGDDGSQSVFCALGVMDV